MTRKTYPNIIPAWTWWRIDASLLSRFTGEAYTPEMLFTCSTVVSRSSRESLAPFVSFESSSWNNFCTVESEFASPELTMQSLLVLPREINCYNKSSGQFYFLFHPGWRIRRGRLILTYSCMDMSKDRCSFIKNVALTLAGKLVIRTWFILSSSLSRGPGLIKKSSPTLNLFFYLANFSCIHINHHVRISLRCGIDNLRIRMEASHISFGNTPIWKMRNDNLELTVSSCKMIRKLLMIASAYLKIL